MATKPRILILGGCGFIGRNIVLHLTTNDYASAIRVVDKTPPQMAFFNAEHTEAFNNPIVEFCSANLINIVSCKNAFATNGNKIWDFVINCAAETRPNQTQPVYEEGIFKLSINCANESIKYGVQRYIELSSGNMNSNEKKPQEETCVLDPWTSLAKYKSKVEYELKQIPGLKYTILRLPIVYGKGDKRGLTPRILIAALYKHLNETMKLLWTESLKINTVHVTDVCASLWELANSLKAENQIFNIVDASETTQGKITNLLIDIFNIKCEYFGVVFSNLTKIDMSGAVEEINDKHMGPWAAICQIDNVEHTPLTPYMDEELLYHKNLNLNGNKLKNFGYKLRVPEITREKIEDIIDDFVKQGLFPQSLAM